VKKPSKKLNQRVHNTASQIPRKKNITALSGEEIGRACWENKVMFLRLHQLRSLMMAEGKVPYFV
jgi:hypothetical protein